MKIEGIHPATRNQHETRNILKTFQVTRQYLEIGEYPEYNHTARVSENLYITELLLAVISLESFLYGTSKHYKIALPKNMPNPDPKGRVNRPTVSASLEFKLKFLMDQSKLNLKYVRVYGLKNGKIIKKKLSTSIRREILKFINAEFRHVSKAVKLRNKLAHGETFYALSGSKNKKKHHLSKFISQIDKKSLAAITNGLSIFQEFCDILLLDYFKADSNEGIRKFVDISRIMKRNDFLAMVGMKASPGFGLITDIRIQDEIEKSYSERPEAFNNAYGYLHSRVVGHSYMIRKNSKLLSGVTKKFLLKNKWKGDFTGLNNQKVEDLFYENYWEKPSLFLIESHSPEISAELFILGVNIGPKNAIRLFQTVLNKVSLMRGSTSTVKVDGIITKKTASLLKKNVDVYKGIIKALIFETSNFYIKKADKESVSLWFELQSRLIYSSKNKTINYSLFF